MGNRPVTGTPRSRSPIHALFGEFHPLDDSSCLVRAPVLGLRSMVAAANWIQTLNLSRDGRGER